MGTTKWDLILVLSTLIFLLMVEYHQDQQIKTIKQLLKTYDQTISQLQHPDTKESKTNNNN